MTNVAALQRQADSLRAILAGEPNGLGGMLVDDAYFRRELALIEIDVRTVDALGARRDLELAMLDALVAITSARLVLRMVTLEVEAVGAAASVGRVGPGHNSRTVLLRSADAVVRYSMALQNGAAADEHDYAWLGARLDRPDGSNEPASD